MADPRIFVGKQRPKSIATSHGLNALMEARRALSGQQPTASAVGAGLRSLVAISKAVGLGGKLPFTIDNVSDNAQWVLNQVGINTQSLMTVRQFNSPVVDAGLNAARGVATAVLGGSFTLGDVGRYQPPLEHLNTMAQHVFVPRITEIFDTQVSPYAMDLLAFAPKYKFLFVVQFTFNKAYILESGFQKQFAFLIKKSSRPTVKYNLEDVNYYNHRTKYTSKAEFEEMSMTFYDDSKNNVDAFFSAYTRAMSPILNYESHAEMSTVEQQGLGQGRKAAKISNIQTDIPVVKGGSGSTGALEGNETKTVIESIRLYQVFDYGRKVNIFNFYNPRLSTLDLDDMDMTSSEVNLMDIKFTYDSVFVELDKTLEEAGIPDITNVGRYNIKNNFYDSASVPHVAYADVFSNAPVRQTSVGPINTSNDGTYFPPDLGVTTTPLIPGGLSSALDTIGQGKINITKAAPSYKPPTTQPRPQSSGIVGDVISSALEFGKKLF